ncbi:MAG TPA: tail fiber domain-containing protein [Ignavibacteria bacterium]|mgnify:CR=1 FL=1|nr:tail fiber domain-containing protein [Ignavibacteria bacterium]
MKKLIIFLKLLLIMPVFLTAGIFSQNITNTLGSSGTFTIKSSASNLFTLSPAGQVNILKTLRLEHTTNSTTGVLYIANNYFMHNYGSSNTFLGESSGNFTMSGRFNTAIGFGTLFNVTTGEKNSAYGFGSLGNITTGSQNSGFGYGSLSALKSGNSNSAYGNLSLLRNTASFNSAFGELSLFNNTTGADNSSFGYLALSTNATGSWNSAFGSESLQYSTMNFNTGIGYIAGYLNTGGSGNVNIGYNSQPSSGSAVNQFTIGNSQITTLRCAVTTITSISDARDKKNIHDLSLGLNFIMKLRPRQYNWDKREWYEKGISDGTKMHEAPTAGFIAQELDGAQTDANAEWLNLVLKDNPEKLEAVAGNLLPVIIKAIQELHLENEEIKKTNADLKVKNNEYKQVLIKTNEMQDLLEIEIEQIRKTQVNEIISSTEENK